MVYIAYDVVKSVWDIGSLRDEIYCLRKVHDILILYRRGIRHCVALNLSDEASSELA